MINTPRAARLTARLFLMANVLLFAYFFHAFLKFDPLTVLILAILFGVLFGATLWKHISNRLVKIPCDFVLVVRYEFSDGGAPILRRLARGSKPNLEALQRGLQIIPYAGPRPDPTAEMMVIPWDIWDCNQYDERTDDTSFPNRVQTRIR